MLAAFRLATELNPALELDPEAVVTAKLVEWGERQAKSGSSDEALAAYRRAKELDQQESTVLPLYSPEGIY